MELFMQLVLNVKNKEILDKLILVLEKFKQDGVEILENNTKKTSTFDPKNFFGVANKDKNSIDKYLKETREEWEK